MAVQFAPAPEVNPALLATLLGLGKQNSAPDGDLAQAVQKAYLGQFLPGVGDTSPVQSPWQGAGRLANGALTGLIASKLIAGDKANNAAMSNAIMGAIGGGGAAPTPAPSPAPSPASAPMPAPAPTPMPSPQAAMPQGAMNAMGAAPDAPVSGASPLNPGTQALVKQLMNPTPAADMNMGLSGGIPPQGIDRSRIKSELDANPDLMRKFADMTFGEVRGQGPQAAQIEAESAANRTLGRNIPLAQALMAVNDPNARQGGKNLGYYASDTYKRPANPQELAQFQNDILPKLLAGSDVGTQTLGFTPTGNASQMAFAGRRAANGAYDASKWLSGVPGKGEMFVTEKGDKARLAQNLRSNFPPELLSPNMDPGNSFAPTQVAGDNVVPQQPQGPAVGQFTPGALPNVPNAQVRPVGPGYVPPQAPQPQMPQQQPMPQQPQMAQPGRATPQVPPNVAQAAQGLLAIGTKDARDAALKLVAPYMQPQQYGFQMTPDGTLIRTNPAMGSAEPVYQSSKPSFVPNATHDQYGNPLGGFVDPTKQTVKVIGPNGQPIDPNAASGQGAMNDLHGEDYLKTLDPGKAETVKGIAEGRIAYPSGFIMKTPYGQWLTQAVGQYEPGIDATKIGQRKTFNQQMGSTSPTSVGGQKTLMGTSLGHLSEIADAATALSNSAGPLPDWMPGSSYVAHGVNRFSNSSTSRAAQVNALSDAVQKFSGEVGKLYSGSSGGGITERDETRARFSANLSPQEMAASLEMSKSLIQSKLSALENQQDQIFGPNNKARVDFLGENGKAALAKIDAAIAKLRGQGGSQAPAQGGLPQGWSVQVH